MDARARPWAARLAASLDARRRGEHDVATRHAEAAARQVTDAVEELADRLAAMHLAGPVRRRIAVERHRAVVAAARQLSDLLPHYGCYSAVVALAAAMGRLLGMTRSGPATAWRSWVTLHGQLLVELGRTGEAIEQLAPIAGHEDYTGTITLGALGSAHREHGRLDASLDCFTRAIGLRESMRPPGHPDLAGLYANAGLLHLERGDYRRADGHLRRALEIQLVASGPDDVGVTSTLNSLALLAIALQDRVAALRLFAEIDRIRRIHYPPDHPKIAVNTVNTGAALMGSGRPLDALAAFRTAREIWTARFGARHPEVATALNNIGWAEHGLGRWQDAAASHRAAIDLRADVLPANHPLVATSLLNLAAVRRDTGDLDEAEGLLRRALAIREAVLGEHHPDTALAAVELATVLSSLGRHAEALVLLARANRTDDVLTEQVLAVGWEEQRRQFVANTAARMSVLVSLALVAPDLPGLDREIVTVLLRRRAVVGESVRREQRRRLLRRQPDLEPALLELDAVRQRVATLTFAGAATPGEGAAHRAELGRLIDRMQVIEAALARGSRAAGEAVTGGADVDVDGLAAALGEREALVECVRADVIDFAAVPASGQPRVSRAHYLAVVLRPGPGLRVVDVGPAEIVDRMVALHRDRMGGSLDAVDAAALRAATATAGASGTDTDHLLADHLTAPVLDATGPADRLYVVPDGRLFRLPWMSLPDRAGRPLVETVEVVLLVSGRDLVRPVESAASGAPVVVADPDFDLSADPGVETERAAAPAASARSGLDGFRPLPGARAEAVVVAGALGVEPLLGAAAVKSAVLAVRSPRVLHLATHGFFLSDRVIDAEGGFRQGVLATDDHMAERFEKANPLLLAGLALAGANAWLRTGRPHTEAGDGFLTAEEVLVVDLSGTALVVLSACDTGLGAVHLTEGPMSLRRSFLLAGADAIVAALWQIPDLATRRFMELFYAHLERVTVPSEALRAAQLAYRSRFPQSTAWAAFDLYARSARTDGARTAGTPS